MIKIENKDYIKSKWSGGTTTQLLIWPPEGDYVSRNFKFRLSSATIEEEESVFTKLPGIQRYLSVLEGKIELTIFEDEQMKKESLNPFEVFSFWGDQKVKSKGKARDFNLMVQNGNGKLEGLIVQKKEVLQSAPGCFFLYLEQGKIVVEKLDSNEEPQELNSKESLYELSQEQTSYLITPDRVAKLMIAWIEV